MVEDLPKAKDFKAPGTFGSRGKDGAKIEETVERLFWKPLIDGCLTFPTLSVLDTV